MVHLGVAPGESAAIQLATQRGGQGTNGDMQMQQSDDLRVVVDGKEVPRWVSTPGPLTLGEPRHTVHFFIPRYGATPQRRPDPMSMAQIRAALKRLPGSVAKIQ